MCSEAAYRAPSPRRAVRCVAVRVAHRVERETQSEARRTAKLYAELLCVSLIVYSLGGGGGGWARRSRAGRDNLSRQVRHYVALTQYLVPGIVDQLHVGQVFYLLYFNIICLF